MSGRGPPSVLTARLLWRYTTKRKPRDLPPRSQQSHLRPWKESSVQARRCRRFQRHLGPVTITAQITPGQWSSTVTCDNNLHQHQPHLCWNRKEPSHGAQAPTSQPSPSRVPSVGPLAVSLGAGELGWGPHTASFRLKAQTKLKHRRIWQT